MMAGTPTTNYQLPTYSANDAPNLTGAYNQAMGKIDTQMKANETAIGSLAERVTALDSGSFAPSEDDATLTVKQLSEAKVTKAGIVYFKSVS